MRARDGDGCGDLRRAARAATAHLNLKEQIDLRRARNGRLLMAHGLLPRGFRERGIETSDLMGADDPAFHAWVMRGASHIQRLEKWSAMLGYAPSADPTPDWAKLAHPLARLARSLLGGDALRATTSADRDLLVGSFCIVREPAMLTALVDDDRAKAILHVHVPETVAAAAPGMRLVDVIGLPHTDDEELDADIASLVVDETETGGPFAPDAQTNKLVMWLKPARWRPLAAAPAGQTADWIVHAAHTA